MLNIGAETTTAIKRRIAEFANVPKAYEVRVLEDALINLAYLGYK